jgi:hypothetical protein
MERKKKRFFVTVDFFVFVAMANKRKSPSTEVVYITQNNNHQLLPGLLDNIVYKHILPHLVSCSLKEWFKCRAVSKGWKSVLENEKNCIPKFLLVRFIHASTERTVTEWVPWRNNKNRKKMQQKTVINWSWKQWFAKRGNDRRFDSQDINNFVNSHGKTFTKGYKYCWVFLQNKNCKKPVDFAQALEDYELGRFGIYLTDNQFDCIRESQIDSGSNFAIIARLAINFIV